jgi:hypothetical protein
MFRITHKILMKKRPMGQPTTKLLSHRPEDKGKNKRFFR